MPQQTERLVKSKKASSTFEDRKDKESRAFYQSYAWRRFRLKMKIRTRAADEKRVHDLYKGMPNTTFESYTRWLQSDNPLCVDCIEEGYIREGAVADHEKSIRNGGDPFGPKNIRFRCNHHHNIKSGKERHASE